MKHHITRRAAGRTLAGLLGLAAAQGGWAQPGGNRPVRFIVPLGPGSSSDTLSRVIAKLTAQDLGPTVVENKPGADTIIAVQELVSAPADGHTLMMLSPTSLILTPLLNAHIPYDPRDLRPLAGMIRSAAVLVTSSQSRWRNVAEVLAAARKGGHQISLSHYSSHYRLGALLLQKMTNAEFNLIPYKTPSALITDVIGSSVDLALMDIGAALPLIASGKMRGLAVTGRERHPKLPSLPTFREAGVEKYDLYAWISMGVLAKTPEPMAKSLEAALLKAVQHPDFAEAAQSAGADVFPASSKELAALVASESARYAQFAKALAVPQR